MLRELVYKHSIVHQKKSLTVVLREAKEKHRKEIRLGLKRFPYFETWTEDIVEKVATYSAVKKYFRKRVIEGKDKANADLTHFLLKGTCVAVKRIVVIRCYDEERDLTWYRLHENQSLERATEAGEEVVLMQAYRLYPGATFGLGERIAGECVILSETKVECMVIPRHLLLRYPPPDCTWERMIHTLDLGFPTQKQFLEELVQGREWEAHLQNNRHTKKDSRKTNLTINQVPLASRIGKCDPPEFLNKVMEKEFKFLRAHLSTTDRKKYKFDLDDFSEGLKKRLGEREIQRRTEEEEKARLALEEERRRAEAAAEAERSAAAELALEEERRKAEEAAARGEKGGSESSAGEEGGEEEDEYAAKRKKKKREKEKVEKEAKEEAKAAVQEEAKPTAEEGVETEEAVKAEGGAVEDKAEEDGESSVSSAEEELARIEENKPDEAEEKDSEEEVSEVEEDEEESSVASSVKKVVIEEEDFQNFMAVDVEKLLLLSDEYDSDDQRKMDENNW